MVQSDKILSDKVSEAMTLVSNSSHSVEARLRKLDIVPAQRAKLSHEVYSEISNCNAKLDEFGALLKSKCQTREELLLAKGMQKTHEFEELETNFNQLDATQIDLTILHQDLASSHRQLSTFAARFLDFQAAEEKHNTEIATIHGTLQRLEEFTVTDHTKFEKWCTKLESLIQEHQGIWESRLHAVESRIGTAVFELCFVREEMVSGLANLHREIKDTQSVLEDSLRKNQEQAVDEIQKLHEQLAARLKEEMQLRILKLQEISQQKENNTSAISRRCDTLKLNLSKECTIGSSQLETPKWDNSLLTSTERQTDNAITSLSQTGFERMRQEMCEGDAEPCNAFMEERKCQLHFERDVFPRQTTESRVDFAKLSQRSAEIVSRIAATCQELCGRGELLPNTLSTSTGPTMSTFHP